MNLTELSSRPIEDLHVLAAKYSIKTHPKHKPETIAKLIMEHAVNAAKPKETDTRHPAEKPTRPVMKLNTEEEVRDIIKAYASKDGFIVEFPGDDTWIFKYRGAEESGHMTTTLRNIKMKAEGVSRGARRLMAMNEHFETMNTNPQSQYTKNVLSV